MSLFGDSPEHGENTQTRSIFGADSTPGNTSTSSLLFADDGANDSPWSMPTPKKNARQNLVRNLLPPGDVPESYIDAFDTIVSSDGTSGGGVSLTAVKTILSSSGLTAAEQDKILNLVVPGAQELPASGLGRNEFNVLWALVGLGQANEDITLDSVDEWRKKLPQPKINYLSQMRSQAQQSQALPEPPSTPSTIKPAKKGRQDSFGNDPSRDPWANSPEHSRLAATPTTANRGLTSINQDEWSTPPTNGAVRTTSAFSTTGDQRTTSTTTSSVQETSGGSSQPEGWNNYSGGSRNGFGDQLGMGGGFGGGGDQPGKSKPDPQTSVSASVTVPPGTGEYVAIAMLPEKEGMFLFQHHNYEVKAVRRGSSVVRRYSDFVWLLDCLQKRYPFRRLPLLPPKRVQVNGNHIAADSSSFLEKRRKGLVRFANQLVQHPVLSQETLVVMFLTVPTELSVWRKQATISVQEEFADKPLPPDLEDSLPASLPELFDQVRAGVKRSCEIYINLCVLLERLARRNEGLAADNLRFSLALETLVEGSRDVYAIDTNDVPLLNEGIRATAKHMSQSQTLLEDEARGWDGGVLEDLKSLRDAMVSMRDVFDRRDRYARNNIPQLEKRIEASENKLHALRNKPVGAVKPGEIEKVESSIISDKESIVSQHARGVFIKECVRDEIVTFQRTIYTTSRLHQDWGQERVKYAELQASNWKALADQLESMPIGDS